MFDNKYPYTDFSQLNLDWFLLKFKELLEEQERVSGKVKDLDDTVKEFTDFVTNYFDNLDVQAEVNVKLNEMSADGTLSDLLAPLVAADIGDVVAAQIDDVVDNQIDDVVADQIGAVVADQIGAAVASEAPDVVTDWLDQNVDPVGSAVVVDSSLSISGAAADAKVTGDKIRALKNAYEIGYNKLDPNACVVGYILNDGTISTDSNYRTTDFIDVSNFTEGYSISKKYRKFLAYDASKTPIAASYDNDGFYTRIVISLNAAYKYIRVSVYTADLPNIMICDSDGFPEYTPFVFNAKDGYDYANSETKVSVKNYIDGVMTEVGRNKLNPNTLVDGYIESNASIQPDILYKTTDFIDVSDFQYGYAINKPFRKFMAYDINKAYIEDSYMPNDSPAQVITLDTDYKYIRITLYVNNMEAVQVADSADPVDYEPYSVKINDGINFLNEETENAVNNLIGGVSSFLKDKKWYACGDSFTQGDFTGATGEVTFQDEPYQGQFKVYPFFIGRRTGMNVTNLAVGGMTMAHVEGRTNDFCTSVYQNVGADADYVTLKFGINDGHQGVPIGTINDNVDTTFYGAWNKVMTWLITNRPTAKIGIIVSNGLDHNDYATATIAIANKFGMPYLNEWSGEQVPVLIRSGRTDVDASIKTIRTDTFKVSADNLHPNVACHEYESTFVETWLKTL